MVGLDDKPEPVTWYRLRVMACTSSDCYTRPRAIIPTENPELYRDVVDENRIGERNPRNEVESGKEVTFPHSKQNHNS